MENNQKPEWFELADNDQPTSRPVKKKSAPMRSLTFVLAGALVIPMGAGVALLTHEDHSTIATESLNLVQDSPAVTSSTQVLPINTIALPTASSDDDDDDYRAPVFADSVNSSHTAVTSVTTNKTPVAITPPGSASNEIILPPTKKAEDDEDEDDEDEDDDDSDDDDEDDD